MLDNTTTDAGTQPASTGSTVLVPQEVLGTPHSPPGGSPRRAPVGTAATRTPTRSPHARTPAVTPLAVEAPTTDPYNDDDNNFSCEAVLNGLQSSDARFAPILFAMSIGLTPEETHQHREEALIASKCVTRTEIRVTSTLMGGEIKRRVSVLGVKEVRPRAWSIPKKEKWLVDHPVTQSEADFISNEIRKYLDKKQFSKARKDASAAANGEGIGEDKKRKMRLFEAIFHDNLRVHFLKRNDSKSCVEVDARNSKEHRPKSFWELAAEMFNDPKFSPSSRTFPDFHSKFSVSFPLTFDKATHKPTTPEETKRIYMEARSMLNKAIQGWKKSGNGCGALAPKANNPNGKATTESECLFGSNGDSDEGDGRIITDNRSRFIGGCLWLGYFWCLVDQLQLTDDVCADISVIRAGSDKTVTPATTIKTERGKGKREFSGVHEMRQIQRTFSQFHSESTAARARDRLAQRVTDCRDNLNQCQDTLQSA